VILVDTSVWIDHLHRTEAALGAMLEMDDVCTHPLVVEELGLGSIKGRAGFLEDLGRLAPAPVLGHDEVMALVEGRRLWGRGLCAVDAHLLGSALVSRGSIRLWTRDSALRVAATEAGVAYAE
jgi:predicted nucleic acid-binding protein